MNRPRITIRQALLIAICAGSSTLALSSLGWLITGAKNGEWTGWIEAVSTALAFAAASVAAIYVAQTFNLETDRDIEWRKTQAKAQAERISIWVESDGKVVARNGSDHPVYDLSIGVQLKPLPAEPFWDAADDLVMPPADKAREVSLPNQLRDSWSRNAFHDYGWCIKFTDTTGQRWYRNGKGTLIQLDDPSHH